ncbi:MAG: class I SAM-dependent methyltransferase [Gemmataceae bacterium]
MLPRVLEPELMDTPEEARDYDAMDHRAVNELFVRDFLAVWDGRNPVLDVGTGTAQIPVTLCQQHARAQVVAVDLAGHMLALARSNVERAGLTHRILIQQADAKALPFPDGTFPAVISNSLVHHIARPELVLREMWRVLISGGVLFVRDLMRPDHDAEVERLVRTYAGSANAHQQAMFEASLRAALTLQEMRQLVSGLGYGSDCVQATSDRHWTCVLHR